MCQSTRVYSAEAVRDGILRDDRAVIEWFYGRLRLQAFRLFCRGSQGSPAYLAMEDCFNPAFILILRKVREGYFLGGNLMAYALKVVRYCYSDERKKARRHYWEELSAGGEPAAAPASACHTAADVFEQRSLVRLLHWYHTLGERPRRLLDLRFQGYNHREAAQKLRLAPGTVRNCYVEIFRQAKKLGPQRPAEHLTAG